MGRLQRIEHKLERAINGAFAKAFRAEVQPVEIASAVRRAMDDRAQTLAKGRTLGAQLLHDRVVAHGLRAVDDL
jgi:hypothetical protein